MPSDALDHRIDTILRTADDVGIGTLPASKKKRLPRRLMDRPSATTLVAKLMLDDAQINLGESAYRVLSASTHGTSYAMLRYAKVIGPSDDPHIGIAAIGFSSDEAILLIRILILGYINAVTRLTVYLGWDGPDLMATTRNISAYFSQLHD